MTQIKNMPHSIGAYLKGVGVESVELDANNHLIVHLDNGETVDAGEFKVDDELDAESTRPLANKTLSSLFSAVNERINTLVGGNATEAIDNLNEIIDFLQNFKDSETLASTLAEINNAITDGLSKKVDKVDGKGLSSNDYTNEEKAQVERVRNGSVVVDNTLSALDETSNKPVSGKGIAEAMAPISELVEKNKEDIAKKANMTEYYPAMAVGVADNLRGRGEATEEEFTYRPSAGASNSISEEGVATMKRIKGNSIVWNNLSASISEMATRHANIYDFDGVNTFTLKADGSSNNLALEATQYKRRTVLNHYYLFIVEGSTANDIIVTAGSDYPKLSDGWAIVQCTSANKYFYIYPFGVNKNIVAGTTFTLDSVKLVDLSQMFGAGNEPSTIEEFYARIPEGIDMNTYNAGEIMSMNINAIRTNGLNQWGEQWELGRINLDTGESINSPTTIRSKNFIPIIGGETYNFYCKKTGIPLFFRVVTYDANHKYIGYIPNGVYPSNSTIYANFNNPWTFDKNVAYIKFDVPEDYGTIYNGDICINLSRSGVRDGEYEPYKESIKDLSVIQKYFPNGMKSVGVVFDEINEYEAVQRVGQRAYTEGDNDNLAVMTDGVNTIYPLELPIVTPMPARSINLNYPVWDWGTERAVSDVPSAPFRADIIYGFNAVDRIRDNSRDIETLFRTNVDIAQRLNTLDGGQGLNVLVFGDSITDCADITVTDGVTTSYTLRSPSFIRYMPSGKQQRWDRWPAILRNAMACKEVRNYALSGATYKDVGGATTRKSLSYQVNLALADIDNAGGAFNQEHFNPDIIIFALGTNDWIANDTSDSAFAKIVYNNDIADVEATLNALDRTKFCEAAMWAFLTIKNAFPYAQCFCYLPIQRNENNNPIGSIHSELIKVANRFGVLVIDGGYGSGIVREISNFTLGDGLHPNWHGQNLMARQIISAIKSNYVPLGSSFMNEEQPTE